MKMRIVLSAVAASVSLAGALAWPASGTPVPPPGPGLRTGASLGIPDRTSFTLDSVIPGLRSATPNEHLRRPGLSIVKLYLVDYAMRHGDHSVQDRDNGRRAIEFSDDAAADAIWGKYRNAIDVIAHEYGLADTRGNDFWGKAETSTADIAHFLVTKQREDPQSPVIKWMTAPSPVAADGTPQDWGTAKFPGVYGTKWGWSDKGPSLVASASIGPGYAVVAITRGTRADEDADIAQVSHRLI